MEPTKQDEKRFESLIGSGISMDRTKGKGKNKNTKKKSHGVLPKRATFRGCRLTVISDLLHRTPPFPLFA